MLQSRTGHVMDLDDLVKKFADEDEEHSEEEEIVPLEQVFANIENYC